MSEEIGALREQIERQRALIGRMEKTLRKAESVLKSVAERENVAVRPIEDGGEQRDEVEPSSPVIEVDAQIGLIHPIGFSSPDVPLRSANLESSSENLSKKPR